MVTYSKEEMVGVTEFGKSMGAFLDKVVKEPLNRLVLIRRNKPEAVIVPIEEYESMKNFVTAVQMREDEEIAKIVEERIYNRKTPAEFISQEDMLKAIDERLKNV